MNISSYVSLLGFCFIGFFLLPSLAGIKVWEVREDCFSQNGKVLVGGFSVIFLGALTTICISNLSDEYRGRKGWRFGVSSYILFMLGSFKVLDTIIMDSLNIQAKGYLYARYAGWGALSIGSYISGFILNLGFESGVTQYALASMLDGAVALSKQMDHNGFLPYGLGILYYLIVVAIGCGIMYHRIYYGERAPGLPIFIRPPPPPQNQPPLFQGAPPQNQPPLPQGAPPQGEQPQSQNQPPPQSQGPSYQSPPPHQRTISEPTMIFSASEVPNFPSSSSTPTLSTQQQLGSIRQRPNVPPSTIEDMV